MKLAEAPVEIDTIYYFWRQYYEINSVLKKVLRFFDNVLPKLILNYGSLMVKIVVKHRQIFYEHLLLLKTKFIL